jgi:hypothetical protein
MKFIELTGAQLLAMLREDEGDPEDLRKAGLSDQTIVRVNQQGDIELRRVSEWDVIGGLLGDYELRLKESTGIDWA